MIIAIAIFYWFFSTGYMAAVVEPKTTGERVLAGALGWLFLPFFLAADLHHHLTK